MISVLWWLLSTSIRMSLSEDIEMRLTENWVLLFQEPIAEASSFYCSSNSSWNTNRYHLKETALVAIQYSCQMNGNESIYQVDPGADTEEPWETTETEAECKHTASKRLKAESFHLKMCAQGGIRSIRSHAELKSFGAGSWGSFCNPRIQKTETGGRPWVWVQPSLHNKFHDSLCWVVRSCLIT